MKSYFFFLIKKRKRSGGTDPRNNFTKFGACWNILGIKVGILLHYRLTDKHIFLSIVTSVFRTYEETTKKVLAQSEKNRYEF